MNKVKDSSDTTDVNEIKKEIRVRLVGAFIFLLIGIWFVSVIFRYPIQNPLGVIIRIVFGIIYMFGLGVIFLLLWFKGKKELKKKAKK